MRSGKISLDPVLKAFDEAQFGPRNILNLRETLPSVADACFRTEAWLRERQMSGATEVLLITGRGNQSPGGISAVREAILGLMPTLRRRGVVAKWREHSPGSFVIGLGSMSSLLEAPRRKRDRGVEKPADPEALAALEGTTLTLLRQLAIRSLESLGIRETEKFVEEEMLEKFNSLARGLDSEPISEAKMREAISIALDQLDN